MLRFGRLLIRVNMYICNYVNVYNCLVVVFICLILSNSEKMYFCDDCIY